MTQCLTLKKSNCKNCYKCIRHCPVKSIRFSGNQAYIIDSDCILCGHCFVVCPQNAKQIAPETERVKVMLAEGNEVYLSLAPSFVANYGVGIEAMREAVKKLGFADAEETAVGAAIVKNEYDRILEEEKPDVLISSCCHSVNLLIQKYYPEVIGSLADVLSPMQAHSEDIKKRHKGAKTVFVGPCVAKKDEADHYGSIVDAVLTFDELTGWLNDEGIVLSEKEEDTSGGHTRLFPTVGGILATMAKRSSDYTYMAIDGIENCMEVLSEIRAGGVHKCFIEMSACSGSCIGGPVMEKHHRSPVSDFKAVSSFAGEKDFEVETPAPEEIKKIFAAIEDKNIYPTDEEITEILHKMGKFKPSDELNCGSCGYNTCRDKAVAIFRGRAEISMCLPYLKDKAESFSDSIVNNTPNGLMVLNEKLEVQQINSAALKIMNIRSSRDILGDQVVRILDPKLFMDVLSSGKSIKNKRIYLAEYERYVEETIVYDREYRLLICIMRDITDEESAREKKESVNKKTVEIADKVVDKQMRIVQEIASLLGETAAETKIALTKLKETIADE